MNVLGIVIIVLLFVVILGLAIYETIMLIKAIKNRKNNKNINKDKNQKNHVIDSSDL